MPRRRIAAKRETLPDPKFGSQLLAKFINMVMVDGKKAVAEKILYDALARMSERTKGEQMEVLEKALDNVRPMVERGGVYRTEGAAAIVRVNYLVCG